jgi:hypothetical protein
MDMQFFLIFEWTLLLLEFCRLEVREAGLKRAAGSVLWVYVGFKVEVSGGISQCPQRDSNLCPAHQRL